MFRYLCAKGVIDQASPGRYYLAPAGEREFRRRRFRVTVALIAAILLLAAIGLAAGLLYAN